MPKPWSKIARRHPSAFLLAAQLMSLILYPLVDGTEAGRLLFGAIGASVVCLAVWVVNRSPGANWVAWTLAVPAVAVTVAIIAFGRADWVVYAAMLESVLYFYAAGCLILYMMDDHRVTTDELFAAGATFTLLAWGFAYAFFVCQTWFPGCFTGTIDPQAPRTWIELLFLSFANLSATGLSDVLPVTPPARVLVMLEQFAGIGYLATLVSRLIGLTIVTGRAPDPSARRD
jgi:hypothetical protein